MCLLSSVVLCVLAVFNGALCAYCIQLYTVCSLFIGGLLLLELVAIISSISERNTLYNI